MVQNFPPISDLKSNKIRRFCVMALRVVPLNLFVALYIGALKYRYILSVSRNHLSRDAEMLLENPPHKISLLVFCLFLRSQFNVLS